MSFYRIFQEEGDGITGGIYHSGLLWALEVLAWDRDFLIPVTILLGELAVHDPGGRYSNRPASSLTAIYLPWLPQTRASIKKRKVALETLTNEWPDIAWNLLVSLLPSHHQVSSGSYRPKFREPVFDEWKDRVFGEELMQQIGTYAEMALSMARNNISRLTKLIEDLQSVPSTTVENILVYLEDASIRSSSDEEQAQLWNALENLRVKHIRHSDANWALPPELVLRINNIGKSLKPTNPLLFNRRLYVNNHFDLFEETNNWEEQIKLLEERRQKATKDINDFGGLQAIFAFVESVETPFLVGRYLALSEEFASDNEIFPILLQSENNSLKEFARGYASGRYHLLGQEWFEQIEWANWDQSHIALFLTFLPFSLETWTRAREWLGDNEDLYWKSIVVNPYAVDGELTTAIDKLIEYDRPYAAINCLHKLHLDSGLLDPDQGLKALLAAVNSNEPLGSQDAYELRELIKHLQQLETTDPEKLFQVEWAYLPILNHSRGISPKTLETRLASDPNFFAEIIGLVYRSRKELRKDKKLSDRDREIVENAWRLLHEWKIPPGLQKDGSFSTDNFNAWLSQTKSICSDTGHLEFAMNHLGHVLVYAPPDPGGLWIDKAAAHSLNAKDGDELQQGFSNELYNSRGAHWVNPTWEEEQELASLYTAKAENVENAGFHRVARMIRELAASYSREARGIADRYGREDD